MNKWIRWRKKYAHGYANWEYFLYRYAEEELEQYIHNELIDLTDEISDKYRGFEFEIIDVPPKEWLTKTYLYTINRIASLEEYSKLLRDTITGLG